MNKSQIYFGLFRKREDVEMVMQEALPKRAQVEFAYRIGTWRHVSAANVIIEPTFRDDEVPQQAQGQQFVEQCMVFYSMDRRLYGFSAARTSTQSKWVTLIFPKIQAARQLGQIPKYVEQKVMSERWGLFFTEVYERMLGLEEMFADFEQEIDRKKLPRIIHSLPGYGVEKPGVN